MRTRLLFISGCSLVTLAAACSNDSKTGGDPVTNTGGTSNGSGGVSGNSTTATPVTAATTTSGAVTTSMAGVTNTTGSSGTGGGTATANTTTDAGTTTGSGATGGAAGNTSTTATTGSAGSGGTGNTAASVSCDPPEGSMPDLGVETIVGGFDEPVFVTQPPADSERLFVVEQAGLIRIVAGGAILETPFLDLEDQVSRTENERGMFAVAFHPNYAANGLLYVHYSASNGTHGLSDGDTVLSEFTISSDVNVADAASERVVLTVDQPEWNHNGGMIAFGPNDGLLYMGLGDGGGGGDPDGNGQNIDTLLASIIRLDVDTRDAGEYGIPAGNLPGGAPELWDHGLRNPWRFSFDACTGDLYIADVGQNDYEEVNFEPAGQGHRNYGWNVREGLSCYLVNSCATDGFVAPVIDYGRGEGVSVTGGYVYRGSLIPALRGTYFYADYQSGNFWAFDHTSGTLQNAREVSFVDRSFTGGGNAGISSFGQDNAGEMYFVLRGAGELLKIVPR